MKNHERRAIMEDLKKLFEHSSDRVIITDYNFNILWRNKREEIFSLCDENCSEFFKNEKLPLESGSYFINHNGQSFECKVINYPYCGNGVYIIQTEVDDVVYSFFKCCNIKEILENYSSLHREAVAGISFSISALRKNLNKPKHLTDQKYLDIIMANCCKLLKPSLNFSELMRYTDGSIERKKIDLSAAINDFIEKSNNVLNEKIDIIADIKETLYINADIDRFEAFLLSLVVVVNDKKTENNIITISVERMSDERVGDAVSITVTPDGNGTDNIGRTFTEHVELYDGDEANPDLIIINRFCKTFEGTLIISENSDKKRSFNIRLPFYDGEEDPVQINTASLSYQDNKYSKYNIMYSKIIY